jgi:glutamyl-tRNA reductase
MNILVVGLNHKSAPVEIREQLAFNASRLVEALDQFRQSFPSSEVVILSTCNRVELYACSPKTSSELTGETLLDFLARFHGLEKARFRENMYVHQNLEAVRHLFIVTSSLDSMVLGESQILAQVKEAYGTACSQEATGKVFHQFFQQALNVAKEVHTHSKIAQGKVSISSVAVEFAEKIFQDFSDKTVFIIGAGEMAELVLKSLVEEGAKTVLVSNRSYDRAEALANEYGGKAVRFDSLAGELAKADIVISSTSAPHYVLHPEHVREAMRRRRGNPMFLIDIAVPRDINPEVGQIENVYLYNIDDLQGVVSQNVEERTREMEKCRAMVEEEVEEFMAWMEEMKIGPAIAHLRHHFHTVGKEELERLRPKLGPLGEEHWREVVYTMERTLNKLLHRPLEVGKEAAKNGGGYRYVETIKKLFGIEHHQDSSKTYPPNPSNPV